MAMSPEAQRLYRQLRGTLRSFDENVAYFAANQMSELILQNLETRLAVVEPMLERASTLFDECEEDMTEETRDNYVTKLQEFNVKYFDMVGQLKAEIIAKTVIIPQAQPIPERLPPTAVQCPRLTLPTFDGSIEQWITFRDLFVSIVHENVSLTDTARFQHLKTCLTIPSTDNVLSGYPVTGENYRHAWRAVCERYDNPSKITSHHLSSIIRTKKMANGSASELRRIIDSFTAHINALEQLGYPLACETDLANQMMIQLGLLLLTDDILKDWRKETQMDMTTWADFHTFLIQQWRCIDDTQYNSKPVHKESTSKPSRSGKAHVSNNNSKTNQHDVSCALCSESHFLWACSQFRNMSVDERHKFVRSNKMCLNCFRKTHGYKQCTSKSRCKTCEQPHHTMLHFDKSMSQANSAETCPQPSTSGSKLSAEVDPFKPYVMAKKVNVSSQPSAPGSVMNTTLTTRQHMMLSTVSVNVRDANGNVQLCRALLDSGSDANMMTTQCAKRLQLQFHETFFPITGINEKTSIIRHKVEAVISSRYGPFEKTLECSLMSSITGQLPSYNVNIAQFSIPKECFIADPDFHRSSDVDMLLSAEVFYDALLSEKMYLTNGPMLIHTKFGWIVGGAMKHKTKSSSFLSCFTHGQKTDEAEVAEKLDKFFQADDHDYITTNNTPEEAYCEDVFTKTTSQDESGKFIVQMPFKINVNELGKNLANAERTLKWQESLRRKDEVYDKLYVEYMEDYIATGHMEEVPPSTDDLAHYLPHHGVLKMSSTSTKLRPVFNASSKSETGVSLNDVLCVGPTVQPESFDILLRSREKKYVLTGDITKMYRQIWIHPSQRKYLRILWRSNLNAPVKHYQLNTVTFGTACAPFLATRVLQQLAIDNAESFPEASAAIQDSFYVDDLVLGVDTIDEGMKIRNQVRYILARSGMLLCKMSANHPSLLEDLPKHDIESTEDEENRVTKTLGIGYKATTDEFCYHLKPLKNELKVTKASILSEIASIYDPIGWIGPVVLTAKLFMKRLWMLNMKWTDEVTDDFRAEWNAFREHFPAVNRIRIPRYSFIHNHVVVELHGFCDASIVAYGAVIYAHSRDSVGNSQTSIICAKSRVAPKNQKTLARLELCGATLLAKLINRTIDIFKTSIDAVTLWSDSTIVLSWMAITPSRLSTYVGNRVAVIQDLTHQFVWKHIRGVDNPADIISRGLQPQEIQDCSIWWTGPSFFKLPKSQWPESIISINEVDPEVTCEMKKVLIARKPDALLQFIETRFSRLNVLINTVAYMQRFITNCKRTQLFNNEGLVTLDEKENAEVTIIRTLQRQFFNAEYSILSKQRELDQMNANNPHNGELVPQLSRASCLISLAPYLDELGLIRVGGRLSACPELNESEASHHHSQLQFFCYSHPRIT